MGIASGFLYNSYYGVDAVIETSTSKKVPAAAVEVVVKDVIAEPATLLDRLGSLKELAKLKMETLKVNLYEKVSVVKEFPSKAADSVKNLVEYLSGAGVETWTNIVTAVTGISSALKTWFGSKAPGLASEISKLISGQQALGQTIKGLGVSVIKNTAALAKSMAGEASKLSLMAKTSLDKLSKAASDRALDA